MTDRELLALVYWTVSKRARIAPAARLDVPFLQAIADELRAVVPRRLRVRANAVLLRHVIGLQRGVSGGC